MDEKGRPLRGASRALPLATVLFLAARVYAADPSAANPSNPLDLLAKSALITAHTAGVPFVFDALTNKAPLQSPLQIETQLGAGDFGRGDTGYFVRGGVSSGVTATLKGRPVLGNRSELAELRFQSTQQGIAQGQHGLVELRLVTANQTINGVPLKSLRVRVENGKFYVLDLKGNLLAGDDKKPAFQWQNNLTYTLKVALFQKGVWCRLEGENLPSGKIDIAMPDTKRWIPGPPGWHIAPSAVATGGALVIKDWAVTPIGPPGAKLGVIGDSITAGLIDRPEAESYVHLVTRGLGQDLTLNTGSGGTSTGQDSARLAFEVTPFKPQVLWVESGTNDLSANVPAATIWANWQREMEAAKRWGAATVLSTVPPRNSYNAAQTAQRHALNQLVRSSQLPFVDRDKLLASPEEPNKLNPVFDAGDGTHLNAKANQIVSEAALPVVRGALEMVSASGKPGVISARF